MLCKDKCAARHYSVEGSHSSSGAMCWAVRCSPTTSATSSRRPVGTRLRSTIEFGVAVGGWGSGFSAGLAKDCSTLHGSPSVHPLGECLQLLLF